MTPRRRIGRGPRAPPRPRAASGGWSCRSPRAGTPSRRRSPSQARISTLVSPPSAGADQARRPGWSANPAYAGALSSSGWSRSARPVAGSKVYRLSWPASSGPPRATHTASRVPAVVPADVPVRDVALGEDLRVGSPVRPGAEHQPAAIRAPRSCRRRRGADRAVPPRGHLAIGADRRPPHRPVADDGARCRRPGRGSRCVGSPSTTRLTSSRSPIQPANWASCSAVTALRLAVADAPDVDVGAVGAVRGPGREGEAGAVGRVARPPSRR